MSSVGSIVHTFKWAKFQILKQKIWYEQEIFEWISWMALNTGWSNSECMTQRPLYWNERKVVKDFCQLLLSLFFCEIMNCKIFFKVRVQIENLACSNLLTKVYFIPTKDRGDRRKRDIRQNYFVSRKLFHFFLFCLFNFRRNGF